MDYLYLSKLVIVTGTILMAPLYIYLYLIYRERFMGIWAITWTILLIRVVIFDSELFKWETASIGPFYYQTFYIVATSLFNYGTHSFINQPLTKYWYYGLFLTIALCIATDVSQLPLLYKLIPPTWFATIVLIYTGWIFINIKTREAGKYITGGSLILWGLLTCSVHFFDSNNEILSGINFICGLLRLFIGCGMVLVYFEKTRADLNSKEEALQQTNRELNGFCHSVAHDLKGPLLSINQLAEDLGLECTEKFNQDQHESMLYIKNKSAELVKITDHLLELSRMSQKQMQIELIQLEPLFREVYNELLKFQERQVNFIIKRIPDIYGDPIMIKLLVRNILSNALKFTRNRKQAIIEVDTKETDNDYIISIKDNGAGFDMSGSSRLFGIFERLHTNEEFEGAGVGLTICQKILKRHNGEAWLTGKIDEGAVFSFRFPKLLPKQHSWPMPVAPDAVG